MERFDGLGDCDLRETLLYARAQKRPVSADDVAHCFEIHRNSARSRLERLVAAGLLEPAFERRSGRQGPGAGRPAKVYAVAPELAAIEFPRRHNEDLVSLLAAALPAQSRADDLEEVGVEFGRRLATEAGLEATDDVPAALDALCDGLRRLGYQASVAEASPDGGALTTPTCPLRPLTVSDPATHPLDRGMWRGLAGAALSRPVATVQCSAAGCLDEHASCLVQLTFQRTQKGVSTT